MRRFILLTFIGLLVGMGFTLFAQEGDDEPPVLQLNVAGVTCDLVLAETEADAEATSEATEAAEPDEAEEPEIDATEEPELEVTEEAESSSEAEAPVISLDSEDCANVISRLRVASNGTLWIAISVPGEEDWQEFSTVEGDDSPLQIDRRGRYIGCANPEEGAQVCSVVWEFEGVTYQIDIPIVVGDSFTAPSGNTTSNTTSNTAVSTQEPSSSTATGQWGACGSCSTCGADSSVCVTNPEGVCVADPTGCRPASSGSGDSGPPPPQTTEEP